MLCAQQQAVSRGEVTTGTGVADVGLLGVDIGGSQPATSPGAAHQESGGTGEPQLALHSAGARKWGPAQFAPAQPAAPAGVLPSTSSTRKRLTPAIFSRRQLCL